MAKKQSAFLADLQAKAEAKAEAKAAVKLEAHVEIDTIAMLLMVHETLGVGPGRADKCVNDFLAWKIEIAESILQELDEDQSETKEIVIVRRNLAKNLQEILGPTGWEKCKTLFPFLRDYW